MTALRRAANTSVPAAIAGGRHGFLLHEFQTLAIAGATQRVRIYSDEHKRNPSGTHRTAFGQHLRRQLEAHALPYRTAAVAAEVHVDTIGHLANALATGYASILAGSHFRIGPPQKLLNLYLKYLWCAGLLTGEPPHCPVDAIVLAQAGRPDIKWTQMDSRAEYLDAIDALRRAAGRTRQTLAEWELHVWGGLGAGKPGHADAPTG